jgi:predicted phage terminase large subunit-like protein
MLIMALRAGSNPQTVIASTPKPNEITFRLLDACAANPKRNKIITGSSYENRSNLPEQFINQLQQYEGTDLGNQEIHAIVSRDIPGALWKFEWFKIFQKYDVYTGVTNKEPYYGRTVIGVDVATTDKATSDFTVICVASAGDDGQLYVREIIGLKCVPGEWAEKIAGLYHKYKADLIVVETNQGGKMVAEMIYNVKKYYDEESRLHKVTNGSNLPVKEIHAHDGKRLRAEPVSMLYQKGRVWHIGNFPDLESQMLRFTGKKGGKDDYVDALVYTLRELAGEESVNDYFVPLVGGTRTSTSLKLI